MKRLSVLLVMAAVSLSAISPVWALSTERGLQHPSQWAYQQPTLSQFNKGMSLSQAVRMIEKRTGGKVLKASSSSKGGRVIHQIKIINDGRVRTIRVDAASGKIL